MGSLQPVLSAHSSASFTTRIATASRLSPAELHMPRSGESLQRTDTPMQPLVRNWPIIVPTGRIAPAHIFHDAGFGTVHTSAANTTTAAVSSIINYTTTDPDHPDYTLLSAHPLSHPIWPLAFILQGGGVMWEPPMEGPVYRAVA
jgi:hypothetical protein